MSLERIIRTKVPCGGHLFSSAQTSHPVSHVTFSKLGGAGSVAKQLQEGQLKAGMTSRLLTMTDSNIQSLLTKNPLLVGEALFDFFAVRISTDSQLFTLYRNGDNGRIKK